MAATGERRGLPRAHHRPPVDAIPDLSDNQIIVYTMWEGRSPQIIEDQVTYPLATNLQGLPHVRAVRSTTMFGASMIYVIFEDKVDLYWARSRVLERLNQLGDRMPKGVTPVLGPDGTGGGHAHRAHLGGVHGEPRGGRQRHRGKRDGVPGPRPGISPVEGGRGKHRRRHLAFRDTHLCKEPGGRPDGRGVPPWAPRRQRRGGGRRRGQRHAVRRERPEGDRAGPGEACGAWPGGSPRA